MEAALEGYVSGHIALLVDDFQNPDKLKRKINGVPLANEKKRKIFVHDENTNRSVDWDRHKRHKTSMFSPFRHVVAPGDVDPILEIYGTCKTLGEDGQSDDVLMFITPCPPANSPNSKNLETLHKVMKHISPKLQQPKLGKIIINQLDVLRRQKQQPAFFGSNINQSEMIFSMQRKGQMWRNPMMHLKDGNLYFNT